MRVAYILGRFPNLTETFIMDELLWIRNHGVDIEILSLFPPRSGPVHERSRDLEQHVHHTSNVSARSISAFLHFAFRSPRKLAGTLAKAIQYTWREPKMLIMTLSIVLRSVDFARQLQGRDIDLVHAHFLTIPSVAGRIVSDLLGVGLTIQPHAVGLFSRNRTSVRKQLEDAAGIVTISRFHRDYVADLCPRIAPETVAVVHCGIETGLFRKRHDRPDDRRFRILSVGRLVEKKGHGDLIDACAVLAARGLPFQCDIVGVGPLEAELRSRMEAHGLGGAVNLLGALNREEVLTRCQSSDVFALACVVARNGDRDGVPVSLMEAMACEVPVVTTPIAGIPDLVEHEVTGLLVEAGDAVGLADSLERLNADPALGTALGRGGRHRVQEEFEIADNAERMARFFGSVVEAQRRV